jgi:3-deoxy-D-manno-octulosonic-acid transferase
MINIFKEKYPQKPVIITTFTETALEMARKITPNSFLIPFDTKYSINRFLKNANPQFLFIAETEIWPALINETSKRANVYMINARMSEKSFKRYLIISPLIKETLNKFEKIFAQGQDSYNRFINFVSKEKVIITGNTKYDSLKESEIKLKDELKKINFEGRKIITFGSVHPDELEIIIKSFFLLKKEIEDIRYVIVPRHIEKTEIFKKIIENFNIRYSLLSQVKDEDRFKDLYETEILIADKLGILMDFYQASQISFVGGTLNKIGGHNLLEPSVYSKPVLFGPNYRNQKEAAEKLIENGGGFVVSDENDIKARIKILFKDRKKLEEISINSKKTLEALQGASERIIKEIGIS